MDVSIIIVNYYTSKLINDCIESIFDKSIDIEYEIIIVDNNTENLANVITSVNDPRIHLIQLKENIGFGRANNEGATIATGRNIFFLNPDTVLLNNAVKILSNHLDSNPDCGGCGGNLYNPNNLPIHSYRMTTPGILDSIDELSKRKLSKLRWGKNNEFNHTGKPLIVGDIIGADLMIPKIVYDKVNGFDPNFFMYYEETDLCMRIKQIGYSIQSVPNAQIMHIEGGSSKNKEDKKVNHKICESLGFSQVYYLRKHKSNICCKISLLILRCSYFLRQKQASFRGKTNKALRFELIREAQKKAIDQIK